ncbi:MAG: type II secretion system protein GspJ [Candidatus Brocadiia bacterium]
MVNRRTGFTLIEVLIAMGTTAMIMTIAWITYAGASASAARCRALNGTQQQARALLAMMAREVRCAYVPPATASPETEQEDPALAGADGALTVLTGGAPPEPGTPRVGLYRVEYRFEGASGVLRRSQASLVGGAGAGADGTACPMLAQGVAALELSFYDGEDWQSEWDSNEEQALPRAVAIELTLASEDGRDKTYAVSVCPACLDSQKPAGEAVPATEATSDRYPRSRP